MMDHEERLELIEKIWDNETKNNFRVHDGSAEINTLIKMINHILRQLDDEGLERIYESTL